VPLALVVVPTVIELLPSVSVIVAGAAGAIAKVLVSLTAPFFAVTV
jgi:hypothetical protein